MPASPSDEVLLRRAFEVALRAQAHGNHPFGAILVGPGGEVQFLAGLEDGKLLAPVSSDVPLVDGALVPLRTGVYLKGAPGVFRVLRALGKQ